MKNLPWTLGFTTSSGHSAALLHLLPLFCVSCRIDHDIIIVVPFGLFSESIMLMWTQCAVVPGGWRLQCHTHFTSTNSGAPPLTNPQGRLPHMDMVLLGYKVPGELATFSPALNPLPWPSHLSMCLSLIPRLHH